MERAPKPSERAQRLVWVLVAIGFALHVYIDLFLSDHPFSAFGLFGVILWPSLPYALCAFALRFWGSAAAIGGCLVALALDAITVYVVFIHPTSSTAALALLFYPLWSLLVFTPLGLSVGRLVARFSK